MSGFWLCLQVNKRNCDSELLQKFLDLIIVIFSQQYLISKVIKGVFDW